MPQLLDKLCRSLLRFSLRWLPPEAFNRLCGILPGRQIIEGLRFYGAQIGERVQITPPIHFHNFDQSGPAAFARLSIGDDCYFGRGVFLDLKEQILIEERVTLAMQVMLLTHTDAGKSLEYGSGLPATSAFSVIRSDAYLGARATILQGVEVGCGALVGAGALVTGDVAAGERVGGVPARALRRPGVGADGAQDAAQRDHPKLEAIREKMTGVGR